VELLGCFVVKWQPQRSLSISVTIYQQIQQNIRAYLNPKRLARLEFDFSTVAVVIMKVKLEFNFS